MTETFSKFDIISYEFLAAGFGDGNNYWLLRIPLSMKLIKLVLKLQYQDRIGCRIARNPHVYFRKLYIDPNLLSVCPLPVDNCDTNRLYCVLGGGRLGIN